MASRQLHFICAEHHLSSWRTVLSTALKAWKRFKADEIIVSMQAISADREEGQVQVTDKQDSLLPLEHLSRKQPNQRNNVMNRTNIYCLRKPAVLEHLNED